MVRRCILHSALAAVCRLPVAAVRVETINRACGHARFVGCGLPHPRQVRYRAGSRRGLSLLEVLMSLLVLTLGLLGVAALLPVGKHEMEQAARSDRASALGQAAFRDLQVRGVLDPHRWAHPETPATPWWHVSLWSGGPWNKPGTAPVLQFNPMNQRFEIGPGWLPPMVLDPLAIAYPGNSPIAGWFPATPLVPPTVNKPPIFRFTLPEFSVPLGLPPQEREQRYLAALRVFSSPDELVFDVPRMAELRPALRPRWLPGPDGRWGVAGTDDDNNGTVDDASEAGWPGSDDLAMRTASGDFTYLVTVAPKLSEVFGDWVYDPNTDTYAVAGGDASTTRHYTVSVVVFYKRNLASGALSGGPGQPAPPERMVWCDFLTTPSWSGGTVRLRTQNDKNWLDVKPGQWILLSGFLRDSRFDLPPQSGSGNGRQRIAAWYRIVSVGEGNTRLPNQPWYYRDVTLAGEDWYADINLQDDENQFDYGSLQAPHNVPSGELMTVFATIVDGAVAVYEKTISLGGF